MRINNIVQERRIRANTR